VIFIPQDVNKSPALNNLAMPAEKMEALFCYPEMRSAHSLTDAQAKRIDTWLPEGMA